MHMSIPVLEQWRERVCSTCICIKDVNWMFSTYLPHSIVHILYSWFHSHRFTWPHVPWIHEWQLCVQVYVHMYVRRYRDLTECKRKCKYHLVLLQKQPPQCWLMFSWHLLLCWSYKTFGLLLNCCCLLMGWFHYAYSAGCVYTVSAFLSGTQLYSRC